jgi:hypothetical protein
MRWRLGVWIVTGLLPLGCAYRVYSPPARSLPLESPEPLPPGATSATGEGAVHSLLFGPTLVGADLRVARGLPGGEVSAEATVLGVQEKSAASTDRTIKMLRAGYRTGSDVFGFGAGLGGGWSAAGAFISPDFALIVGYENCYLVPFGGLRAAVSLPIAPSAVDVSRPEDGVGAHVLRPRTTFLFNPTLGLKVPLGHRCAQRPRSKAALLFGLGWSILADLDQQDTYVGASAGLTVSF